jgi:hypothetical protein
MKYLILGATISLLIVSPALGQGGGSSNDGVGYINACAQALIKSKIDYHDNDILKLQLLSQMESTASDDNSLKAQYTDYTELTSGGLDNVRKTASSLRQSLALRQDYEHNLVYSASQLTGTSAHAFNECVDSVTARPGLYLKVANDDGVVANLSILFRTSEGDTTNYQTRVYANGSVVGLPNAVTPPSGQNINFGIARINPAHNLHVFIQVTHKNSAGQLVINGSSSVFIYPLLREKVKRQTKFRTSSESAAGCFNTYSDGNHVQLRPDPGYQFDPSTIRSWFTYQHSDRDLPNGANTFKFSSKDPNFINGYVYCDPGAYTDINHAVRGKFEATEYQDVVDRSADPKDNHKDDSSMGQVYPTR